MAEKSFTVKVGLDSSAVASDLEKSFSGLDKLGEKLFGKIDASKIKQITDRLSNSQSSQYLQSKVQEFAPAAQAAQKRLGSYEGQRQKIYDDLNDTIKKRKLNSTFHADEISELEKGAGKKLKKLDRDEKKDERLVQNFDKFGAELKNNTKAQSELRFTQNANHRQWELLTRKEIDVKLKEKEGQYNQKLKNGEIDDRLKEDIKVLKGYQSQKGGGDERSSLETFLRNSVLLDTAKGSAQAIGNYYGKTTAGMVQSGTNVATAGLAGGPIAAIGMAIVEMIRHTLDNDKERETTYDAANKRIAIDRATDFGRGLGNKYGYSADETIPIATEVANARGFRGSDTSILDATQSQMRLQEGLGFKTNDLESLYAYSKGTGGKSFDVESKTLEILNKLQSKGIVKLDDKNFDLTKSNAWLQKIAEFSDKTFQITGKKDSSSVDKALKELTTIAGKGGIFSNEQTAAGVLQRFQSTLEAPRSEYEKFQNVQTLKSLHPNLSPLEIAKRLESGEGATEIKNAQLKKLFQEYNPTGDKKINSALTNDANFILRFKKIGNFESLEKAQEYAQGGNLNLKGEKLSKDKLDKKAKENIFSGAELEANNKDLELFAGKQLIKAAKSLEEAGDNISRAIHSGEPIKAKEILSGVIATPFGNFTPSTTKSPNKGQNAN